MEGRLLSEGLERSVKAVGVPALDRVVLVDNVWDDNPYFSWMEGLLALL